MKQYKMSASLRLMCIIFIVIGVICMGITVAVDDEYLSRFWSNILHNSVFFTGIGLMALFIVSAFTTAYAGWFVQFKRLWEAIYLFLPVGLVLMIIIAVGNYLDYHHLYEWNNDGIVAGDEILQEKSNFLNRNWFMIATILIVGAWYFLFAIPMRRLSLSEDKNGDETFSHYRKTKVFAAIFLPVAGFSSAAIIWQWIMSLDPHWYSTMFAWYTGASWFVSTMCITVLLLIYLRSRGYYQFVTKEHLHDLGKYVFAFSIFWTYLWFSQYMLIWYANNGEETIYFNTRHDHYPVIFYANLLINFILPFFVLMRNDTKRKLGTMVFVCIAVFFGHWLDFFLMIKPGVAKYTSHLLHADHGEHAADAAQVVHDVVIPAGFVMPGLLEIGTFLGFLGLFLWFVLNRLSSAPLIPARDPFIQESLHHEVWFDEDHSMQEGGAH